MVDIRYMKESQRILSRGINHRRYNQWQKKKIIREAIKEEQQSQRISD